jgi:hypothetical protein
MTMGERRTSWCNGIASLIAILFLASSCTLYHSKIPIADTGDSEISSDAVFVTEDDSGLALLGIFVVSEPDHYSVLMERARRRYKCERLHHVQLDFYSDYWLFVGFPIARITAICEPEKTEEEKGGTPAPVEPEPAPKPEPAPTPVPETPAPESDLQPNPHEPATPTAGSTEPG